MYQYLMLLETEKEKEFFKKLYDLYSHEMYYVSYAILQNSSDAEDIVHDTGIISSQLLRTNLIISIREENGKLVQRGMFQSGGMCLARGWM